jgi:glutamate-1-semialdehyde aminotransferase
MRRWCACARAHRRARRRSAPFDLAAHTVAVPFNDLAALGPLASRDIACVLAER